MEGVGLSAKFALMPNCLGHCGTDWFAGLYSMYLRGKVEDWYLKAEMRNFTAHFEYLRLIAECNEMRPFDERVVEAFWIGNELLESVKKRDLEYLILEGFAGEEGMSRRRAVRCVKEIPEGVVPHHSFHVLHLGSLSGKFKPTHEHADCCLVRSGIIRKIKGEVAEVDCWSMRGVKRERMQSSINGIRSDEKLEKGDVVAVHWGMMCAKLSEAQERNLIKYTRRNLELLKGKGRSALAVPAYSTTL